MKDYSVIIENLMDGIITNLEEAYDYGYDQGYADAKSEKGQNIIDLAHKEIDRAYQRGLEDAWEVAKKIVAIYKRHELQNMGFKCDGSDYNFSIIVEDYTAQEAIAKIKAYEKQQKQDTELKVGDEVVIDDSIGIVTRAFPGAVTCYVMRKDGSSGEEDRNDCNTTGRHFDAIAEVLSEMRGESE